MKRIFKIFIILVVVFVVVSVFYMMLNPVPIRMLRWYGNENWKWDMSKVQRFVGNYPIRKALVVSDMGDKVPVSVVLLRTVLLSVNISELEYQKTLNWISENHVDLGITTKWMDEQNGGENGPESE
jgi:hypothetical protein